MNDEIGRNRPVHFPSVEKHNCPTLIFVTVCTKDRKSVLANPVIHELLIKWWKVADEWLVGRYVIMPDHVHFFCAPNHLQPSPLRRWMAFWKNGAAREWPIASERPIWQRDFWDTQLRHGESYEEKWEYVCNNPARHGLVSNSMAWPYQGEIATLPW